MPIRIREIAFVFHPVSDCAKARAFYEKTLGLKTGLQIEFAPGQWWIEYDIAGVALAICNAAAPEGGKPTPASALALEVADLDEALAGLRESGARITQDVMTFPTCRMFAAADPDGNEIRFHQLQAPRP